jgi:hypothetical protein
MTWLTWDGSKQDAKTESAQQAINKLNSLKMFFDQFPSMLVTDAATVCIA